MLEFELVFITKLVETIIHFPKFHAVKLLETKGGYDKIKIPFREDDFGDSRRNQWHSDIITTALNSVRCTADISYLKFKGSRISTIVLQVDFLRSAKAEAS